MINQSVIYTIFNRRLCKNRLLSFKFNGRRGRYVTDDFTAISRRNIIKTFLITRTCFTRQSQKNVFVELPIYHFVIVVIYIIGWQLNYFLNLLRTISVPENKLNLRPKLINILF